MAKINEVAPQVSLFEGVDRIDKSEIVGQEIKILAYADMVGDDGNYCIALIEVNDKQYTTTFSSVISERLQTAIEKVGKDESKGNEKEIYFKEVVSGTLTEKKSQKNPNRTYFNLE